MRIEYELKFKDYLLFHAMHQLFSVQIQVFYIGSAAFLFYSNFGEQSLGASVIEAVIIYLAFWIAQLLFNVFYLCFGKNRSLFTSHIVEIRNDAFYEETQFGRSYHFWAGLAKVISRPGYIAVYTNANAAHILPSRAFSGPKHRQEFLSALLGKLKPE